MSMVNLLTYCTYTNIMWLFSIFLIRDSILDFIYFVCNYIYDFLSFIWHGFIKRCFYFYKDLLSAFAILFVVQVILTLILTPLPKYICSYYTRWIAAYYVIITIPAYLYTQMSSKLTRLEFYTILSVWMVFSTIPTTYVSNKEQYETRCIECTIKLYQIGLVGFGLIMLLGVLAQLWFGVNIFEVQKGQDGDKTGSPAGLWLGRVFGPAGSNWQQYFLKPNRYFVQGNISMTTMFIIKILQILRNIFWFIIDKTSENPQYPIMRYLIIQYHRLSSVLSKLLYLLWSLVQILIAIILMYKFQFIFGPERVTPGVTVTGPLFEPLCKLWQPFCEI